MSSDDDGVARPTTAGPARQQQGRNGSAYHDLHPAWLAFVNYCQQLQHGDIERLKIQDGLPVLAEVTTKKVKFG